MLKKILLAFVVLLVVLVIVIALQPNNFRVERSITIAAPAEAVFPHVNDLHKWEAWSPWAKIDPAMKQSYSGEPAGPGAEYSWNGNNDVGEGRMTITESQPNERIHIKLEFIRPFAETNDVDFRFQPQDGKTKVVWSIYGKNNFISKAIGLFISMDKMIGGQFEQGLSDLKTVVEAGDKKASE